MDIKSTKIASLVLIMIMIVVACGTENQSQLSQFQNPKFKEVPIPAFACRGMIRELSNKVDLPEATIKPSKQQAITHTRGMEEKFCDALKDQFCIDLISIRDAINHHTPYGT